MRQIGYGLALNDSRVQTGSGLKCFTSSEGGGSLFMLLEPKCSKWEEIYKLSSESMICVSRSLYLYPTWGAPFIVQGGAHLQSSSAMYGSGGSRLHVVGRGPPPCQSESLLSPVGVLDDGFVSCSSWSGSRGQYSHRPSWSMGR
jgi:hypothetical protein